MLARRVAVPVCIVAVVVLVAGCSSGGGKQSVPTTAGVNTTISVSASTAPKLDLNNPSPVPLYVRNLGKCPAKPPAESSTGPPSIVPSLKVMLVPIAAINVRICEYGGVPRRLQRSGPVLVPVVAFLLVDDTNRLRTLAGPPECRQPPGASFDFLTFATDTRQVDIFHDACGFVTNGERYAESNAEWLKDALRATPSPTATVITAHPATTGNAPCVIGDLAFTYYGGGVGSGSDFGTIRIRDISARPCALSGPVVVSGTTATGAADTQTVTYRVAGSIALTARAPVSPNMQPPPAQEVVADLQMSAEYRDDSTSPDTLCHTNHVVVPASWRLTFAGGTRTLANRSYDPAPDRARLSTCNGEINTPSRIESAATGF